jgi:hypothetical protein
MCVLLLLLPLPEGRHCLAALVLKPSGGCDFWRNKKGLAKVASPLE